MCQFPLTIIAMIMVIVTWLTDKSTLKLISSQDHSQSFLSSLSPNTPRASFELVISLNSSFVDWGFTVMLFPTPRRYMLNWHNSISFFSVKKLCKHDDEGYHYLVDLTTKNLKMKYKMQIIWTNILQKRIIFYLRSSFSYWSFWRSCI